MPLNRANETVKKADFEVSVPARLVVECDTGERWNARSSDLLKFGFVDRLTTYGLIRRALIVALNGDPTESPLNPLRYLVELAIFQPELLDEDEIGDTLRDIAALDRVLRDADPKCHSCDEGTCSCECPSCVARRTSGDG
jgi:hypothetical protein